jgi:hypothetical protein
VTGDTLLKLRLTQQLQLILRDAISDSASQATALPASQVVSFASSNLSFSLAFTGVEWGDTSGGAVAPGGTEQQQPVNRGLVAVTRALQQLVGDFDAGHISASFQAFPAPRRPTRLPAAAVAPLPAAAGSGPQGGGMASSSSSGAMPPVAASTTRRLLQAPHTAVASSSSSSNTRRRLAAAAGAAELTVVYVRFWGADPTNVTSLEERLAVCTPPARGAAAALPGAAAGMVPGQRLSASCSAVLRRALQAEGVAVSRGPRFSVAPFDAPHASIALSVAVGLTQEQQVGQGLDKAAGAWLNSSALNDILSALNLTVDSGGEGDYVSYLRDPGSGRLPLLPGLGSIDQLMPTLFQQVAAAAADVQQQLAQSRQAQGKGGAPAATNKSVIAGICVAVAASVLALVGVVVLLLRRSKGDAAAAAAAAAAARPAGGGGGEAAGDDGAPAAARRRRVSVGLAVMWQGAGAWCARCTRLLPPNSPPPALAALHRLAAAACRGARVPMAPSTSLMLHQCSGTSRQPAAPAMQQRLAWRQRRQGVPPLAALVIRSRRCGATWSAVTA